MPLPIIIGAAALAAASYGAKKGYDGYQKHSEADEIVKDAKSSYETGKNAFDEQEKTTQTALSKLGEMELDIGKSFNEFKTLADSLLKQLNEGNQSKLELHIPKHELQKIENYGYTAVGVLGSVAGAGAAGAAAGFAVYGGVMTLGAASTGTAISSLAGAAATKATLAAIGGGSLATGGLGIAGGTAILGAAVAAPVLAIAGWAYDNHGNESLKNAQKINNEVAEALRKLNRAQKLLEDVEKYTYKIRRVLSSIYRQFNRYYFSLQDIEKFINDIKGRNVDVEKEIAKFGDSILRAVENGYALAAILTNMILTPIFKPDSVGGTVSLDENGAPKMQHDSDGLMILNNHALDQALNTAETDAENYKF